MLEPFSFSSAYPITQMKGSQDRITSCTTTQFDGVISVIDPDSSWVARWQRTGPFELSLRSCAKRSRTNFSEICPWDICCSRYWTHTRRCWARTRAKKYQISSSRSNWPGLGTARALELATKPSPPTFDTRSIISSLCTLLGMCRKIRCDVSHM